MTLSSGMLGAYEHPVLALTELISSAPIEKTLNARRIDWLTTTTSRLLPPSTMAHSNAAAVTPDLRLGDSQSSRCASSNHFYSFQG